MTDSSSDSDEDMENLEEEENDVESIDSETDLSSQSATSVSSAQSQSTNPSQSSEEEIEEIEPERGENVGLFLRTIPIENLVEEQGIIVLDEEGEEPVIVEPRSLINPPPPPVPTPPSAKKRKLDKSPNKADANLNETQDEGEFCSICYDNFSQAGEHRLTSLKCGHIFGHSCIKTWIQSHNQKCCPQCKSRALMRDFRFIYAAKIRVIDNSREVELERKLDHEKSEKEKFKMETHLLRMELEVQRRLTVKVNAELEQMKQNFLLQGPNITAKTKSVNYRLFLEKNIELAKDSQSRVMTHGVRCKKLLISQKSMNALFPGFGIRVFDMTTYRPGSFINMGAKTLRDLSFDQTQQIIITASMESSCKLFNINSGLTLGTLKPTENAFIWSCQFDKTRNNFAYLGMNNGIGYIYDIRQPNVPLDSFDTNGDDRSPIINISSINASSSFPLGGFLVCHLRSVWFYEYSGANQQLEAVKLNVNGPFISMNYDEKTDLVLLNIRACPAKYVLGRLVKTNNLVMFQENFNFNGSRDTTVMARSTQIRKNDSNIVACYVQDAKQLQTWETMTGKMQEISVTDSVTDMSTIYWDDDNTYVAALSENRCKIFKLIDSSNFLPHVVNKML